MDHSSCVIQDEAENRSFRPSTPLAIAPRHFVPLGMSPLLSIIQRRQERTRITTLPDRSATGAREVGGVAGGGLALPSCSQLSHTLPLYSGETLTSMTGTCTETGTAADAGAHDECMVDNTLIDVTDNGFQTQLGAPNENEEVLEPTFPGAKFVGAVLDDSEPVPRRIEYYSLNDLLHKGFYLPEFISELKYFTHGHLLVPLHEVRTRRTFHANYGKATSEFKLTKHSRHLHFCQVLGRSLISAKCAPHYTIKLGFCPQVRLEMPSKRRPGTALFLSLTSETFLKELATYLELLARSVYVYCRCGFLHSGSASICRLPDLDAKLDELLLTLLGYGQFISTVGFVYDPAY